MDANSPNWQQVARSEHSRETDALNRLREMLPDAAPIRGWTNFQFTNGGRIHEVDALVVTAKGGFVIEEKSWTGSVSGDQGTWTQTRVNGSKMSVSSPANLTAAKARALASLIKGRWSYGPTQRGPIPIFLQPLVWFSDPGIRVNLPAELRSVVAVTDPQQGSRFPDIYDVLLEIGADQAGSRDFQRVTEAQSEMFAAAMKSIGIREIPKQMTIGDYDLDIPSFAERGDAQDFLATHRGLRERARIRIYSNQVGMGRDLQKALDDAARREHQAAQQLADVKGVVPTKDYTQTEFGPAVLFRHDDRWQRLDHYLAQQDGPLAVTESLDLIESLASTLREVHRRRISHRMLTPQSVWLKPGSKPTDANPAGSTLVPLIADLSLAAQESGPASNGVTFTRVGALPVAGLSAVEAVVGDRSIETYVAPEMFTDPAADGVATDVYSLGAIAYLLITGRPPAADRNELREVLGQRGLALSARMPEVDTALESLVRRCTTPIVSQRFERMSDVLAALSLARASVTGHRDATHLDPLEAEPGDVLVERFEVKALLGRGSTASALLCHDNQWFRDVVLKVSLGAGCDDRIRAERDRLEGLDQANIVTLHEMMVLNNRPTLVLSVAGTRSLDQQLRSEGPASPEDLQRWGDDLLEAVRYLEKVGVWHRDIKPPNLAIGPMGKSKAQHLVLFDFSLSAATPAEIDAGTPRYLEPFLGTDRPFDLAAERYAVAVTLHEMATGELPVWGDNKSDPNYVPADEEAVVAVEAMEDTLRPYLSEFFARALRRNPAERFDTAEDMLRAWNQLFAQWEEATPGERGDGSADDGAGFDGADSDGSGSARSAPQPLPTGLTLDDAITSLGRSKKVQSALKKCGANTVRDVARLDAAMVNRTRGVSVKTRRAVVQLRALVLERFGDQSAAAGAAKTTGATTDAATDRTTQQSTLPASARAAATSVEPAGFAGAESAAAESLRTESAGAESARAEAAAMLALPESPVDLDTLRLRLVPPEPGRGQSGRTNEVIRALLTLDDIPATAEHAEDWPTATVVAQAMGLTRARVSQVHSKARGHWATSPQLAGVLTDVVDVLASLGGVAGVSELVGPLLSMRDTGHDGDEARRLATAVIRAAVEADPRPADLTVLPSDVLVVRRCGRRTLLALDGAAFAAHAEEGNLAVQRWADSGVGLSGFDPDALLAMAVAVGHKADELVATSKLVSSSDAVPALRALRTEANRALSDARLVRLAAAAGSQAVANAASDLVALDTTPEQALSWSRQVLAPSRRFTADELAERVAVRFPQVTLPPRPQLDQAIADAGLRFAWSDEHDAYLSNAEQLGIEQLTIVAPRAITAFGNSRNPRVATNEMDPAALAAMAVENRLAASVAEGGYLALRVPTDRLAVAQQSLTRWTERHVGGDTMPSLNLEAMMLRHLRAEAERRGVVWSNVPAADDPAGPNWQRLSLLGKAAAEATIAEVLTHCRCLLWFPGALVRHGKELPRSPLDQLRDAATERGGPVDLLWLVVLGGQTDALPMVDGTGVPIVAPSEWLDVSEPWLNNAHRAVGNTRVEGHSA